ncbi:MAG: hypothetical protein V4534_07925 [Myxococcota bacterium]
MYSRLLLISLFSLSLQAQPWYRLTMDVEGGFNAILGNQYQSGSTGTRFNFASEAKQNFLFPNWRASLGLNIYQRHDIELTYQPIFLDTLTIADRDLKFDDVTISKGSSFQARYFFPLYRLSYFYRLINLPNFFWSVGAGLQMRSASISFFDETTRKSFVQTNIGPVPLLLTRLRYEFDNHLFMSLDAAGWWSPIPIANGSDKMTTGWIYDTSVRGGIHAVDWLDVYISTRLIGGGADGDGSKRTSGESYTYNTLNVLNFTTGLVFYVR